MQVYIKQDLRPRLGQDWSSRARVKEYGLRFENLSVFDRQTRRLFEDPQFPQFPPAKFTTIELKHAIVDLQQKVVLAPGTCLAGGWTVMMVGKSRHHAHALLFQQKPATVESRSFDNLEGLEVAGRCGPKTLGRRALAFWDAVQQKKGGDPPPPPPAPSGKGKKSPVKKSPVDWDRLGNLSERPRNVPTRYSNTAKLPASKSSKKNKAAIPPTKKKVPAKPRKPQVSGVPAALSTQSGDDEPCHELSDKIEEQSPKRLKLVLENEDEPPTPMVKVLQIMAHHGGVESMPEGAGDLVDTALARYKNQRQGLYDALVKIALDKFKVPLKGEFHMLWRDLRDFVDKL